jgi:enamine deaminase RidA (YjgF/YER057c/UK114 family)
MAIKAEKVLIMNRR